MSQGGPGKKVANRLVVLSSAAVLAVYAAGYVRTQAAAEQLEDKLTRRRPPAQPATEVVAAPVVRESSAPPRNASPEAPPPSRTEPVPVIAAAPQAVPTPEAPVVLSVTATIAPPPAVNQVPAQVPVQAPVAVEQKVEVVAPASAAEPPAKPKSKWHDGKWSGWGTSRHGDIEATVTIEGGRILSAVISQCYTRYPCDYIDHLPPQVAQRQSADVDTVSRATESADAFYFAISSALAESQKGK